MASEANSSVVSSSSDTNALLPRDSEEKVSAHGNEVTTRWNHPALRFLKSWWKTLVVVLAPLVFIPLPLVLQDDAAKAAYVTAIIAVYWMTEAIPLAVTSLLPLVFFPALGVLSAKDTASNYLNDTTMLYVGGLMLAVAIEKWNLHKRMALLVLMVVGSRPTWLLFGFMVTTAFLSMWISNTATAAMMLPIANAVLMEMKEEQIKSKINKNGVTSALLKETRLRMYNSTESHSIEMSTNSPAEANDVQSEGTNNTAEQKETVFGDQEQVSKNKVVKDDDSNSQHAEKKAMDGSLKNLSKVLILGVAYAANIGGSATLTGTGSNLVLSGDITKLFPDSPGINFGLWFLFATPTVLLALLCSWLYLSLLYCDDSFRLCIRKLMRQKVYAVQSQGAKKVIKDQYKMLGPITYAEVCVFVLFVTLILLWLFREPKFIPGWGSVFNTDDNGRSYFSDTSTVIFIVFLLFTLPSQPLYSFSKRKFAWLESGSSPRLLDWNTVQHKLPWDVVILLGSGFALAAGAEESGLSAWIGRQLLGLKNLPKAAIAVCVSIIMATTTELISNVAATTLFLPILAQLAVDIQINPLYLMIPATVSASYAFMLPVATPPNAIAFSYGYIRVIDMVVTGIFMNIICIGIVTLALNTLGVVIFDLGTFPDWANRTITSDSNTTCFQWTNDTRF